MAKVTQTTATLDPTLMAAEQSIDCPAAKTDKP